MRRGVVITAVLLTTTACGPRIEKIVVPPHPDGGVDGGGVIDGGGIVCSDGACPNCPVRGVPDSQALGVCTDGAATDGGQFAETVTCPGGQICKVSQQCAVPRYADNGDGTVTDSATGLVWQQNVSANPCPQDGAPFCTWVDAKSYCAELFLNGGCWRLPALEELFSLYDVSGTMNIDEAFFPMPDDPPHFGYDVFWSSSLYQYDGNAFIIAFGAGGGGIDANEVQTTAAVRCVR